MKTLYSALNEGLLNKRNKSKISNFAGEGLEKWVKNWMESKNIQPGSYRYVDVVAEGDSVKISAPDADVVARELWTKIIELGFKDIDVVNARTGKLHAILDDDGHIGAPQFLKKEWKGYRFTNIWKITGKNTKMEDCEIIVRPGTSYANIVVDLWDGSSIYNTKFSVDYGCEIDHIDELKGNVYDCKTLEIRVSSSGYAKTITKFIKDLKKGKATKLEDYIGGTVTNKCEFVTLRLVSKTGNGKWLKTINLQRGEPLHPERYIGFDGWWLQAVNSRFQSIL